MNLSLFIVFTVTVILFLWRLVRFLESETSHLDIAREAEDHEHGI